MEFDEEKTSVIDHINHDVSDLDQVMSMFVELVVVSLENCNKLYFKPGFRKYMSGKSR